MDIDLNNWDNILLIGDPVILFMLKKKDELVSLNSNKDLFPIEFCLYGVNAKTRINKIKSLIVHIENKYNCKSTLVIKSDRIECIINNPYCCFVIHTKVYKDSDDILDSQAIDCRCVGYNGTTILSNQRFDNAILHQKNTNNDHITTEDYIRILYYKEFGFKFQIDPLVQTLSTFDITKLKNQTIGYIYKNNMKFFDVLNTLIKYYKTLKLENVPSILLEYENSRIYYYYTKIDDSTLYYNGEYDYLITSDDINSIDLYLTKSDKIYHENVNNNMIFQDNNEVILNDDNINNILSDNVQIINNNGFDLAGRSPLYISLLYRSVKSSLYLYDDEDTTLDVYHNMNSVHVLCKEGLTDFIDLPEDINKYLIIDEFGITAYLYTLIFNRFALFKEITSKIVNSINIQYILKLAIILKRNEIVFSIICNEFDINNKLIEETPLHLSIKYANFDVFNLLVDKGANLYISNAENQTAIGAVIKNINITNNEVYKNMLNILLNKKIDLQKDFFFKNLLTTNSEWVIDNIITKYHDCLNIKHNDQTLLRMVKCEISELEKNMSFNDFVLSEENILIDYARLNRLKYLRKLLEINATHNNHILSNINTSQHYYISFNGNRKDKKNDHINYTDLYSSVWDSNLDRFKSILIDNKLDLNIKTSETNRTILNICIEKDSFSIFKFIIELIKSSINDEHKYEEYLKQFFITYDKNNNLLLSAFQHNSVNCLDYLLHSNDISILNIVEICLNKNNGFLKYAFVNQNIELVSYLLRTNIIGDLPSLKCSETLINKLGIRNNNLMLDCIQKGSLKSLFYMITKLPKIIDDYKIDNVFTNIFNANYTDLQNKNYLHHLCMVNYSSDKMEVVYDIVKMFHKMNSELINGTDNTGKTPLFYACVNKDHILIQLLLQLGSNTDIIDEMGWSSFHYLVSNKTFVDKKKISVFTRFNSTLLNSKTLYEKQTPLILAAKIDIPEYVFTLIALKVNTRSVDILGNMYTHYAMYNGSVCARDIKIDYHENNFGMTPLECLEIKIKKEIFNGNFDFVSKIIDVYDKNSKIYTHRVICKKENMIKMRQNFIKLIDNKKLMVIQNLIM